MTTNTTNSQAALKAEIEEWKHMAMMAARASRKNLERAEKAESRLAEIQRGVEWLTRYEFRTGFKLNVSAAGMLPDVLGNYVMFEAVESLLKPQGQADTSGLSG